MWHRKWMILTLALVCLSCGGKTEHSASLGTQAQPLLLAKADFLQAEWYIHEVMVDVPYGGVRGFEGLTSSLEKVRWEITEDYLIAYRSYEKAPGSDPSAADPGWHEEPVAMYPIIEHVGPSSARWFERQSMYVDFTDQLDGVLWAGMPLLEGTSFTVREADDPDDFQFDYFRGAATRVPGIDADAYPRGALYHFDFTNRVAVEALSSSLLDCRPPQDPTDYTRDFDPNAYEIGVRTSLLRVPKESDYEPVAYDATDQNKFGYFRVGRQVVDPYFGERLSGRVHVADRHNIWADTWQRDSSGERLRDAEGRLISKPFSERSPRPIAYFLSEDFPEQFVEAAEHAAQDWDLAFRRTAATAQGKDPDSVGQMVFVCHNPVRRSDADLCGKPGTRVRKGDLRYHQIVNVDQPQNCSPLGYGPSHADPETGQLIASQAVVYEAQVNTGAQYALDLIRFINGDLTIEGLQNPDEVREAVRSHIDPEIDPSRFDAQLLPLPEPSAPGALLSGAAAERAKAIAAGTEVVEAGAGLREKRRSALKDSGLLDLLQADTMLKADTTAGLEPAEQDSTGELGPRIERLRTSPIKPEQGCALPNQLQDAVFALAKSYLGRTDYEQIRSELSQQVFYGVVKHELGHTFGLRHNFAGSWDYVNYSDQYWELKSQGVLGFDTNTFSIAELPLLHPLLSTNDLYLLAQQTQAQVDGGMRRFATSSVMDYQARFFDVPDGIGKYDQAAILYGYTTGRDQTVTEQSQGTISFNTQERGYVEVFEQPGDAAAIFGAFAGASAPEDDRAVESVHYHTLLSYLVSSGADPFSQPPNVPADPQLSAELVRDRLEERRLERFESLDATDVEVPYLYLEDLFAYTKQSAYPFDSGSDPLEQALDTIGRYRDLYPLEYFGLDRTHFDPEAVAIHTADRYLLPMFDSFNRLYLSLSRPAFDFILDVSRQLAGAASLNALAEVAASTPDYGSYQQNGDVFELISHEPVAGADLYVPPGQGRRWQSVIGHFPNDIEYVPYAYTEAGHQRTAHYALDILGGDVPTYFLVPGAGYAGTSAGPMDLFGEQLTTLFNALYLQDSSVVGPRVLSDGAGGYAIVRPPLVAFDLGGGFYLDPETFDLTVAPMDDDLSLAPVPHLDVAHGYSQKVDAGVLGMMLLLTPSSGGPGLDYQDQARVFRVDSGEELTPGTDFETLVYCDTLGSGLCFGALQKVGTTDPGLAARLVLRAQALHPAAEAGDVQAYDALRSSVDDMDLLRSLYDAFGTL